MFDKTKNDTLLLIGRAMLAAMFILSGWSKLGHFDGTAAYMSSAGVPGFLLPLVILTELGGGLAILFGFQTRLAAIALAGFTVVAALIFHSHLSDQGQYINFMKNIAIAGGFLALASSGPGHYSVDARVRRNSLQPA